ncbi:MAG TPA: hypothetical protein VML75_01790 [Kofleriaceae bacterium]|nr:hypothetical protein [Kofleriaceae bacterium]
MEWYAEGPGGLRYEEGDVVGAARASGLGRLLVVPKVRAQTGEDQPEPESLAALQVAIQERGLSWQAFDFGADGEAIAVPIDADLFAVLGRIAEAVAVHAGSVIQALEREAAELESLTASIELRWEVGADEREALVAWLNEGTSGHASVTDELLRSGEVDDDWYEPPAELEDVFSHWDAHDEARHLVAHAHARALLSGAPFLLHQPDDDYQVDAWKADGAPGFVLFTPAKYPFIDLLAQWLGVPEALRQRVFYLHASVADYDLPPEEDIAEADEDAGNRFLWFVAWATNGLPGARLLGPKEDDGLRDLTMGWHMEATEEQLFELLVETGLSDVKLDDVLEDGQAPALRAASSLERLSLLKDSAPSSHAALEYILGESRKPPALESATMALLLAAIRDVELPKDVLARIAELVRAVPPE